MGETPRAAPNKLDSEKPVPATGLESQQSVENKNSKIIFTSTIKKPSSSGRVKAPMAVMAIWSMSSKTLFPISFTLSAAISTIFLVFLATPESTSKILSGQLGRGATPAEVGNLTISPSQTTVVSSPDGFPCTNLSA